MSKKKKKQDGLPRLDERPHSFLSTWSIAIICLAAIVLSPTLIGAARSLKVHANNVKQWLPKNFEASEDYDWFIERFGVDEMVAISWPGCTLDNPDVLDFCNTLRDHEFGGERVFERTITAKTMLDKIMATGVSEKVAKQRVRGLFIGPDDNTTVILAFPSSATNNQGKLNNQRREIIEQIYAVAEESFGISPDDLKLGGPTVDGAAIDLESRKALEKFMWVTVVIVFFMSWIRLKDLLLSLNVMVFSVGCAFLSLAILYWTGGKMNLTMIMLPTLTFILGVSACIHMANYYRKAVADGYGWLSADEALKVATGPVAMSSLTTAIGLASLGMSQVMPIRMFGIYSAIGIMCSLPIILLLMPSILFWFRGRVSRRSAMDSKPRRQQASGVSRPTSLLVHYVCRWHWWITVPALIALVGLSLGTTRLEGSVDLQNRFSSRTKIIQDYNWLEKNLGGLVPMEVVVRFGPENDLSAWNQMLLVEQIENNLKTDPLVTASLSAKTFKPLLIKGKSLRSKMQRRLTIQKWQREVPTLADAQLVRVEGDSEKRKPDKLAPATGADDPPADSSKEPSKDSLEEELASGTPHATLWRISLRVNALEKIDYGHFLDSIQGIVNKQLAGMNEKDVTARFTGAIPLFYHAQHQILTDLMVSFATAFIFISIVLMIVLRSILAGLVAMIPNVFPPLVVFGAMGWLGVPIEIGSVMTASVALGIAVDDTIHFLTWYRRGVSKGRSRLAAIRFAFEHCAKPMIDTTLICGFGVAAFMLSDFMPTVRFSRLLFILLMAALVGDLILLPSILAGPAGRLFRRSRKPKSISSDPTKKGENRSKKRGGA